MDGVKIVQCFIFGLAQACGLISFFSVMALFSECGGIVWEQPLNVHGFLMFVAVYLQGLAISAYRILPFWDHKRVMLIHGSINSCVLAVATAALGAALYEVEKYSLHGFTGIITFFLFAVQWWIGAMNLFIPDLKRSRITSFHRAAGAIIFSLTILTSMMGLYDYLFRSPKMCKQEGHRLHDPSNLDLPDARARCILAGFFTLLYGFLTDIGRSHLFS